jgi:hypothetical protein
MHALTIARQRLQAQIEHSSAPKKVRLAHDLVETGKPHYLPSLTSALAQDILSHGYDARTLDRIYANAPLGDFWLLGKAADRLVLDLPIHEALRERLQATVGEMCAAAILAVRQGEPEVRVLSAPCGLAFELIGMVERLRSQSPETLQRLRCWGVDPDRSGSLLPEAQRRAAAAGARVRFIREDLRRHREVQSVANLNGPFHVVSCVGISEGRTMEETGVLLSFFSRLLAPGGILLVDRWQGAEKAKVSLGPGLQMPRYPAAAFRAMLAGAGLSLEREHPTAEGGCILTVVQKPGAPTGCSRIQERTVHALA